MNPTIDILRAVFALAFVLGLMWCIGFLLKKYGNRLGLPEHMTLGRNRRLQLVEILSVDHRTKVALIRHDTKEHLILIGTDRSEIIERNMVAPVTPLTEKA